MPRYIDISDFSSPELDTYARLTEVQLLNRAEPGQGLFIAESPNVVARALDAGIMPVSALVEYTEARKQQELLARCGDIPVYRARQEVLSQLTGFGLTRGLLVAMRRPKQPDAEQLLSSGFRRVAVLERVVNPTNVGAIFRSAAALNMDAVLLTRDCSNPLYRRAIRVSMGTVFQVPWAFFDEQLVWPSEGLALLAAHGFATAAMALRNDTVDLDDPRLHAEEKLAIILGTEGDGLAAETIADCDYTIRIPMSHGVDSLNVAAASAVAFWELGRRQSKKLGGGLR